MEKLLDEMTLNDSQMDWTQLNLILLLLLLLLIPYSSTMTSTTINYYSSTYLLTNLKFSKIFNTIDVRRYSHRPEHFFDSPQSFSGFLDLPVAVIPVSASQPICYIVGYISLISDLNGYESRSCSTLACSTLAVVRRLGCVDKWSQ